MTPNPSWSRRSSTLFFPSCLFLRCLVDDDLMIAVSLHFCWLCCLLFHKLYSIPLHVTICSQLSDRVCADAVRSIGLALPMAVDADDD